MEKAIRKISILTRDINNFINISLDWSNITLSSWETDKWDAKTIISANTEWDFVDFGINWKFILDVLKVIESDELVFNIASSEAPIVFKDKEDKWFTYIIRPFVK